MPDDEKPGDLPEFFKALLEAFEQTGEDTAIVTIILPSGQLGDFEISYLGEHDPDAEYDEGEPIRKDDTQG